MELPEAIFRCGKDSGQLWDDHALDRTQQQNKTLVSRTDDPHQNIE